MDDGGDEASLILTSFSSMDGLSWGKRLRRVDESLRTIVRLGIALFVGGVGMVMTPSLTVGRYLIDSSSGSRVLVVTFVLFFSNNLKES